MSGTIPSFPQYAFMAWCSVKAQGQLYIYLYLSSIGTCLSAEVQNAWSYTSVPQRGMVLN